MVIPGFNRPTTRKKVVPRIIRSYVKPGITYGLVVQTSAFGPTQANGMLGNTPTIVCATPSRVMLRPMMLGSPPIRFCQKFSVTNATSAPSSFFFNDTATTEIYTLSLHDAPSLEDTARRPHDR